MIEIKESIIRLTEQTVHELVLAVAEARENYMFEDIEIPDGDMSIETRNSYLFKKGLIEVKSGYSKESFLIQLGVYPNSQESESLGYKLVKPLRKRK